MWQYLNTSYMWGAFLFGIWNSNCLVQLFPRALIVIWSDVLIVSLVFWPRSCLAKKREKKCNTVWENTRKVNYKSSVWKYLSHPRLEIAIESFKWGHPQPSSSAAAQNDHFLPMVEFMNNPKKISFTFVFTGNMFSGPPCKNTRDHTFEMKIFLAALLFLCFFPLPSDTARQSSRLV